jgi:hypothetical protein
MNILERALEMCRLEEAMTEDEVIALTRRDVSEQFDGEAFARLLAATILGFSPPAVKHEAQPTAGSVVHNVVIQDGFEARNA